jgi:hypothetical protein
MRDQACQASVRCPDCNEQWLRGRLTCAACQRPLRVRRSYFAQREDSRPFSPPAALPPQRSPVSAASHRWLAALSEWWLTRCGGHLSLADPTR